MEGCHGDILSPPPPQLSLRCGQYTSFLILPYPRKLYQRVCRVDDELVAKFLIVVAADAI